MKSTLFSLLLATILPAYSFAKVEDFNAMIIENSKAQNELQADLKEQLDMAKQAQIRTHRKEYIEVSSAFDNFNSPTDDKFLTFRKEAVHYRPSEAKQMQRIANEIKAAEQAF